MSRTYSISELAQEFDVTTRTLRFYEDKGLLKPQRRGTVRIYRERDRVRLRLALRGKRLGFSLDECREIIEMYDPIRGDRLTQLKRLQEKIAEHRDILLAKREDLNATLKNMAEIEALCARNMAALQTQSPSASNEARGDMDGQEESK